jgi:hypothetical protein
MDLRRFDRTHIPVKNTLPIREYHVFNVKTMISHCLVTILYEIHFRLPPVGTSSVPETGLARGSLRLIGWYYSNAAPQPIGLSIEQG